MMMEKHSKDLTPPLLQFPATLDIARRVLE